MRMRIGPVAILATLVFSAGCSGAMTETETTLDAELPAEAPSTTEAPSSVETIPPGMYSRVILREEAIAEGFAPDLVDAMLGTDGEMPLALEITADGWTIHVTNDAGFSEVGDLGTNEYDANGNWIARTAGGFLTYEWSLVDGMLTLTLLPPFAEDERFVTEGVYHLSEDGAGGDSDVVTLDFANTQDDLFPQIQAVLVAARELAEESLDFKPLNRYAFGASGYSGAEGVVVDDVRSGEIAMGWVGARALPGFEPLLAPMLVDSYELQLELFERGIPQGMFTDPDIQVIAVLPGPMRKMMGVDHPFLEVDDFAGQTVAGDATTVAEDTMRALGATPVPGASGMSLDGIDGLQAQLAAISGNGYEAFADSVTANLNLWPRPLVIIMNTAVFEQLSSEQQEALLAAGRDSIAPANEASLAEDDAAAAVLCASDLAVLEATGAGLASILEAVQPVYQTLEGNSEFAATIEQIRSVKEELAVPPASLQCN